MSAWTYINGVLEVKVLHTEEMFQEEIEYLLKLKLRNLPVVSGSEGNMQVYVNKKYGHNTYVSWSDFEGEINPHCEDDLNTGRYQETYLLTFHANLRDRYFEDTMKELISYLNRLSRKIRVEECLISVKGYSKKYEEKQFAGELPYLCFK